MFEQNIANIIAIWYFMAVTGILPPKICPVIMPGSETNPIVNIVATIGLMAAKMLFRTKGFTALFLSAPNDIGTK